MILNDNIEHDPDHFLDIHNNVVLAILALREGRPGEGERMLENTDCDLCTAFALANIASRLGTEDEIRDAGEQAFSELMREIGGA